MSYTPVTRNTLLKDSLINKKRERDNNREIIESIIYEIYTLVISTSKTTSDTFYYHIISSRYNTYLRDIYINNMPEILSRLEELFPGSIVSHAILSKGNDGKLYNIAELTEDDLKKVDIVTNDSYIIVNWT
jgi:hypothetical protein